MIKTRKDYALYIRNAGTWGEAACLQAIANLFDLEIWIYTAEPDSVSEAMANVKNLNVNANVNHLNVAAEAGETEASASRPRFFYDVVLPYQSGGVARAKRYILLQYKPNEHYDSLLETTTSRAKLFFFSACHPELSELDLGEAGLELDYALVNLY